MAASYRCHRRTKLRLDVISTLPYDLFTLVAWAADVPEPRLLFVAVCLRAPKLLRCYRLLAHVRSVALVLPHRLRVSGGGARLLTATALYLLIWHIFACLWLLVAYAAPADEPSSAGERHHASTWMSVDKDPCAPTLSNLGTSPPDDPWFRARLTHGADESDFRDATPTRPAEWAHTTLWGSYARALYFTITVLSTVGYGDVRPQNALETVLCQAVALCASVSCAGLIALISSLVRINDVSAHRPFIQHSM